MRHSDSQGGLDEDSQLIREYLESGDTDYLGKLYEKYKQRLFLHCLKLVKHVEEAQDLASEVFIKAFGQVEKFQRGAPFFPWLARIATNLCIDHLRKRSRLRFQEISERHAVEEQPDPDNADLQIQCRARIVAAMRRLKPEQRRCFALFYLHHLSYRDIAKLTGYSYNQVRSHIQNGRRRFKNLMERSP
ncbi:MAG: sigma-70 family RNA polymerase sigma factor [Calditrichaeota bacterium]|nr:MAG: sigma-70 family RNA polymerase sigma factor [Calditrichota bacterium]